VGRTPDVRPLLFLWWHEPDRSGCRFCGGPIASGRGRRSLIRIQPPQPIESFRAGGQTPARSFLWPHEHHRSGCRFCGGPITSGRGRRSFPVQIQPPQPIESFRAGGQTPARSFLWPHEPDRSGCRFCGGPITSGRGRRSFPVQTQPPQPIQFPWAGRQMSGPFVSVATRGLQNGLSFWWRTGCIGPGPKVVNRFKSNPRNQSNTSGPETRLRPFASLVA